MIPLKLDESVRITLKSGHTISGTIAETDDWVAVIDTGLPDPLPAETTFVDRGEIAAVVYRGTVRYQ